MADAEPTEACESPDNATVQREQSSQQHAAQELQDASTELVLKSDLTGTSRSGFSKLPREVEIMIWTEAIKEEARGTIVAYEPRNNGLFPSRRLVSSVSRVNKCAYTIGTQFYNIELNVICMYPSPILPFAITDPPISAYTTCFPYTTIIPDQKKGKLRLNLNYTTLVFGLDDYDKYYETLLTEPLTRDQCWEVKRVYEIMMSPKPAGFIPPCCWTCTWRKDVNGGAPYPQRLPCQFEDVQICRALIESQDLDQRTLSEHYSWLNSEDLWDKIKRNLVTCGDYLPVEELIEDYELDREYRHVYELA